MAGQETAGMSQAHLVVLESESEGMQEPQKQDSGSSGGRRM